MSRSINGDGGNTNGVATFVMDQTENKQYVFDGELVLFEQVFVQQVVCDFPMTVLSDLHISETFWQDEQPKSCKIVQENVRKWAIALS